jgi:DNA polymerase I-like protein with 3'-5' exonuclease and polymerase domains
MGAYLQGFEAVVIKKAMQLWHEELHKLQIPFKLCATVHDEYCIETNSEFGLVVGEVVVKSIQEAGKHFNTNCPLDGTARIGHSWSEIH